MFENVTETETVNPLYALKINLKLWDNNICHVTKIMGQINIFPGGLFSSHKKQKNFFLAIIISPQNDVIATRATEGRCNIIAAS